MIVTGRQNPMVAVARATYGWTQGHAKQPGRRYGPAPKSVVSGQGTEKGRRAAKIVSKGARKIRTALVEELERAATDA